MDPNACRAQLARMLSDETNLLAVLAQQLQREHELLVANDVDSLEKAADARQNSIVSLARLDDERRSLCRMLGHGADQVGLASLLNWCDPGASLTPVHAAVASQAQACRDQNDRNGALVNARLNRLSGMLDMLNGSSGSARTYEAKGMQRQAAVPQVGRMVSISA
jgi:flagellar biosynthesis/type III secretory pathway chaperone